MSFFRSTVQIALFFVLLPQPMLAEPQDRGPIIVELYTSMGCSSCPPADEFLGGELKHRNDTLPLAFHVDYWDYLGWKDSLAQPEFTMRQRRYAREHGKPSVYTPQMIVQGRDFLVGSDTDAVEKSIAAAKALNSNPDDLPSLEVTRLETGEIKITGTPSESQQKEAYIIHIFQYLDSDVSVRIERGENANRRITYSNPVMWVKKLAEWQGTEEFSQEFSLKQLEQHVNFNMSERKGMFDTNKKGVIVLQTGHGYGPIIFTTTVDW